MAACPRCRGRAFFDGLYPVGFCRNALCFMAAPSVGRRSRQRQGVVSLRGKENGGLDFSKPPLDRMSARKQPARQRFFSFPPQGRSGFTILIASDVTCYFPICRIFSLSKEKSKMQLSQPQLKPSMYALQKGQTEHHKSPVQSVARTLQWKSVLP